MSGVWNSISTLLSTSEELLKELDCFLHCIPRKETYVTFQESIIFSYQNLCRLLIFFNVNLTLLLNTSD